MSLKLRITLWFSFMILLLTALVVSIVFLVSANSLADDPTEELIKTVSMNVSRLTEKDKKHGDDDFIAYRDGVYCQLLNSNGQALEGASPDGVTYNKPLKGGTVFSHKEGTEEYFIYDMQINSTLWIRGYISSAEPSETTRLIVLSTVIILPIIIFLSIFGGWIITKRSLKPMDKVIKSVESINSGDDLSKRISLSRGPIEIRKLSNEFDRMMVRLDKSFEAEKQFASDVSHELRTPLTIALGECHRARSIAASTDIKDSLKVIEKQCNRMTELVDTLLSLTRLQQKTDRFPVATHNISEFLEALLEDFREGTSTQVEKDIEPEVFASYNPSLMLRIMCNLLDNAKKYSPKNTEIRVSLKATEKGAEITVCDHGVGISSENLPKIWNRFWQADPSRTENRGIGLGLSLVKEMVDFQGGKITVESQLGKGTKFTIQLK